MKRLLLVLLLWSTFGLAGPGTGNGPRVTSSGGGVGSTCPTCITALNSYWSFNTSSSKDDTGNGHDGTDTSISYVTGRVGKAASFTGSVPSIINLSHVTPTRYELLTNYAFTLSIWVNPTAPFAQANVFGQDSGAGNGGLYVSATGFLFWNNSSTNINMTSSAIPTGQWTHLVIEYTSTNGCCGRYTSWVNGVQTIGPTLSTGQWHIQPWAWGSDGSGNNFTGLVDETGFWTRNLTQAEITSLYNNGNGLTYPF